MQERTSVYKWVEDQAEDLIFISMFPFYFIFLTLQYASLFLFNIYVFIYYFLTVVQILYNVVLVSAVNNMNQLYVCLYPLPL